jgi:hypothetical protein
MSGEQVFGLQYRGVTIGYGGEAKAAATTPATTAAQATADKRAARLPWIIGGGALAVIVTLLVVLR